VATLLSVSPGLWRSQISLKSGEGLQSAFGELIEVRELLRRQVVDVATFPEQRLCFDSRSPCSMAGGW